MLIRLSLIACSMVMGASLASGAEMSFSDRKLDAFKQSSVFITVNSDKGLSSGSGFVFDTRGGEAFILTNHHVIDSSVTSDNIGGNVLILALPKVQVVFGSGTQKETVLDATVLCSSPMNDLAIVSVAMRGVPAITFPRAFKTRETDSLLICGYPFGNLLGVGDRNPAITLTKASVASLRRDEWGKLATIQIDGALNPGNSGGPAFDAKGQVLGVAVATVRGAHVGFLIPVPTVTDMLAGQPAVVGSEFVPSSRANVNRFKIVVGFADPFQKLTSAKLHFHRVGDIPDRLPQLGDDEPGWPLLTRQAATMSVQITRQTKPILYRGVTINAVGEAEITIIGRRGEINPAELMVQFETTHAGGPKRYSDPIPFRCDFSAASADTVGFQFPKAAAEVAKVPADPADPAKPPGEAVPPAPTPQVPVDQAPAAR